MFRKTPLCQILPLADQQVAFAIDGRERLRWHASPQSPRPYFFPLIGPSGLPLTRMGHPGAYDHDHHRSIWFAHHKVLGIDFWSDQTDATIRQQNWYCYQDGDDDCRMACQLHWYDGHNPAPLIKQQLFVSVAPDDEQGVFVEIQTDLFSVADSIELQQTNFGLLAVRVAAAISGTFGDGVLTGDQGATGEENLFGKPSAWIDYSGSIDEGVTEGITYFDHVSNQTFPSKWHVRTDGWMGASICRDKGVMLKKNQPTQWRYLLHAHAGKLEKAAATNISDRFNASPPFRLIPSTQPHTRYDVTR